MILSFISTSEADKNFGAEPTYRARDMACSNVAPIPSHNEQGQSKATLIEAAIERSSLQKV